MRVLAMCVTVAVALLGLTACHNAGFANPALPNPVVSAPPSPDPLPTVQTGARWTGLQTRYREGDTITFYVFVRVTGKRPVFAQPYFIRDDGKEYAYQATYGPFDGRGEGHEFAVAQVILSDASGFEEFAEGHTLQARVDFLADRPGGARIDSMKVPLGYFVCANYFSCY